MRHPYLKIYIAAILLMLGLVYFTPPAHAASFIFGFYEIQNPFWGGTGEKRTESMTASKPQEGPQDASKTLPAAQVSDKGEKREQEASLFPWSDGR